MEDFPFADAPAIIRSAQKDTQVEHILRGAVRDLVQWLQGVRVVHSRSAEIDAACSALYLSLTTLVGARTLGEEYTDLFYITSKRTLPGRPRMAVFVALAGLSPLIMSRWVGRQRRWIDEASSRGPWYQILAECCTPAALSSVNLAIFYLVGAYYQLGHRLLGLRYALGRRRDPMEPRSSGGYELLGLLMALRGIGKLVTRLREPLEDGADDKDVKTDASAEMFTLENPQTLPWVPPEARACNLCLEPLQMPTATLCGHLYCWDCITEWCRKRPECPLCRQACAEQHLLVLAGPAVESEKAANASGSANGPASG